MLAMIIKTLLLKNRITCLHVKFDTEAGLVRARFKYCDKECEKIITFEEIEKMFSDHTQAQLEAPDGSSGHQDQSGEEFTRVV